MTRSKTFLSTIPLMQWFEYFVSTPFLYIYRKSLSIKFFSALIYVLMISIAVPAYSDNSITISKLGELGDGVAYSVMVQDNYAYVAAAGIVSIIDVSNPEHPEPVGYFDAPLLATKVYVQGSYAYVVYW